MSDKPKRHYETPKVLHDGALRKRDRSHFHFDDFAVTLARLIASPGTLTPLTIGVSGPWGSGKTTLLARVRELLVEAGDLSDPSKIAFQNHPQERFRRCHTVWFDAWKYATEEQVLAALLRVIMAEMRKGGFWAQVKAAVAAPTEEKLDWLGLLLDALSRFTGAGDYGIEKPTEYRVGTPLKNPSAFFDYFDQSMDRLLASWVGGKLLPSGPIEEWEGALVVFIDHLDRCLPETTVQVLEAVKLFFDKHGCVFVLGADTEIVQEAVASHYQNMGITGQNASDYLEKIIQIRFTLPSIAQEAMQGYIEGVGDIADEEVRMYWQNIVVGGEITPRQVKTFVNDVNLQWAMLKNTGLAEGIDRGDFTCWHVLMCAAPAGFIRQMREIADAELRFGFMQDALQWGKGVEAAARKFKDHQGSVRLKRVLRQLTFSERFDAQGLNTLLHMTSPPPALHRVAVEDHGPAWVFQPEGKAQGKVRSFGGMDFMAVPKGRFLMGSKDDDRQANEDENPQLVVEIPEDFWIARYPVTSADFAEFVGATAREPSSDSKANPHHPVVDVSWHDAVGYCRWLDERLRAELGMPGSVRLPTEAEWEKAARGEYGNLWPWGNEFDLGNCNTAEAGRGKVTSVGSYPTAGDSPYRASDMAGNVWEWCHSLYRPYPYSAGDGREDPVAEGSRVLRGGSFLSNARGARSASRLHLDPDLRYGHVGFRVAVSPIPISER